MHLMALLLILLQVFVLDAAQIGPCNELLAKARENLVTKPVGRSTILRFQTSHGWVEGKIHHQIEYEKRFNLGQYPFAVEDYAEDRLIKYSQPSDVVTKILNSTFGRRLFRRGTKAQEISAAPLTSSSQHFHGVQIENYSTSVSPANNFVAEIQSQFIADYGSYSWDLIKVKYLVGLQAEKSTYFDTMNLGLAEKGIAVRLKEWSPIESSGSVGRATAKSFFLKLNRSEQLGSTQSSFTVRDEYHLQLPEEILDADIKLALKAFLEALKISVSGLAPIVEINNTRYGLDLNYYQSDGTTKKVGFVVVDSFSGTDLRTKKTTPSMAQIEVELLPTETEFFLQNENSFASGIAAMTMRLNAKETQSPKYLQVIDTAQ